MKKHNNGIFGRAALAFTATLWLGLLIGVSFLATPVKFAAPTLATPVALDVGRVTFAVFSKVEWVMAALTVGCLLLCRLRLLPSLLFALLVGLLALQTAWLLPILDARIAAIIAGTPLTPTNHHLTYIAVELGKAGLLLTLAVVGLRGVSGRAAERTAPSDEETLMPSRSGISFKK